MDLSPHQLAERRVELSAEYSGYSERLEAILTLKPGVWMEMRKKVKSDKQADRAWDASEMGIEEMQLRLRMKAIEKKLSAAKTMLEVYSNEAKNQY